MGTEAAGNCFLQGSPSDIRKDCLCVTRVAPRNYMQQTNLCELEMLEHCYYSPLKTLCKENNVPTYLFFFYQTKWFLFYSTFSIQQKIFSSGFLAWTLKPRKMCLFYDSLNRNHALYHFQVAECTWTSNHKTTFAF